MAPERRAVRRRHALGSIGVAIALACGLVPFGCGKAVTEPPVTPLRDVGAACAFDEQCATQVCSGDRQAGTCGVCIVPKKLGEACDGANEGCAPSATCDGGVCKTTEIEPGQPCELGPLGEDTGNCDDESWCRDTGGGNDGSLGICTERVGAGEACGEASPTSCALGTVCDTAPTGQQAESGTCVPVGPRADGDRCLLGACADGFFCGANGTCEVSTLGEGEACGFTGVDFVDNDCAVGLTCGNLDFPNGGSGGAPTTCLSLPLEGSPCLTGTCDAASFCEHATLPDGSAATPTCALRHTEGDACEIFSISPSDSSCAQGLECRAGTCQPAC